MKINGDTVLYIILTLFIIVLATGGAMKIREKNAEIRALKKEINVIENQLRGI